MPISFRRHDHMSQSRKTGYIFKQQQHTPPLNPALHLLHPPEPLQGHNPPKSLVPGPLDHTVRISLQEIFSPSSPSGRYRSSRVRHGTKDGEFRFQILLQTHDARDITASIAIIRRRPYGHYIFVLEVVFVPFVHKLMSPSY